ncbi:hypothetical protein V12G01_07018 [Vibrio alginolyticus 12G01]|nr:hypothetical protein V12G01_07018 [Vibrio alginolyticus 12G01]
MVIHHLHGKLNERIPQRIDTGQIDALVAPCVVNRNTSE